MELEKLRTEYLVIFDLKDSICTNMTSFSNLIKSNSNIDINGDNLTYKGLNFKYFVQSNRINNEDKIYFHIKLICEEVNNILFFEQLLKDIRKLLTKITSSKMQTLWDDTSFYYANKAYPLINEIENLMRKLITKFMLTNVGVGWTKANVPTTVKESIRKKDNEKREELSDYLYETDFIQLANFLFDEYQTESVNNLFRRLSSISDIKDITLEELKSFVPKSNWERYFSNIVDCDHEYLRKRWEKLYDFRCKIAHNNKMNREDYEITEKLFKETKEKLKAAIDNLDKVNITNEEKDNLAQNMVINTDELYGMYIAKFKNFEDEMYRCAFNNNIDLSHSHFVYKMEIARILYDNDIIDESTLRKIDELVKVRNKVVHQSEVSYSKHFIESCMNELDKIILHLWEGGDNTIE